MKRMHFPSIKDVASVLAVINRGTESVESDPIDVRLQVYDNGTWAVRTGDPQYDLDHSGYWGASSLPGVYEGKVRRCNTRDVARDLLEQCREMHATSKLA